MSKFIVKPDFWAVFPHASIAVVLAKGVDNAAACPEAVSYTHLDVYKRQVNACAPAPRQAQASASAHTAVPPAHSHGFCP